MRIRIRPKWLSNCTGNELRQMNRLRFKGDSMMYEDVILLPKYRDRVRVFLAKEDARIVAWCCLLLPPSMDYPLYVVPKRTKYTPIYTYVNKAYRGLRLGRRLLKRAAWVAVTERYKPTVFYWDDGSQAFFESVRRDVSKLQIFDVAVWDEVYE